MSAETLQLQTSDAGGFGAGPLRRHEASDDGSGDASFWEYAHSQVGDIERKVLRDYLRNPLGGSAITGTYGRDFRF